MRRARNLGYTIELVFIGTEDVEINLQRVALRVFRDGHNVPEIDVRWRFKRSFANLRAAIALADQVALFDNSGETPEPVLIIENGKRFELKAVPQWVKLYS